jgi:NAD(P)-dependent dehydrogenase (short-subunit alcohol dehydrogenase family)
MPKANEHIVVIGGTSGIGLSLARAAHALGCKLTIGGRGAKRVSEIATSIGPGVTGLHVELDDPASIRTGFTEGPVIDHLVLVPIDQLATRVKNFDVAAANKAVHVKLTGSAVQRGRGSSTTDRRIRSTDTGPATLFLTSRILEAEPYRSDRFEVGFGLATRHRLAVGRATG